MCTPCRLRYQSQRKPRWPRGSKPHLFLVPYLPCLPVCHADLSFVSDPPAYAALQLPALQSAVRPSAATGAWRIICALPLSSRNRKHNGPLYYISDIDPTPAL
jgi:hypothetical protein